MIKFREKKNFIYVTLVIDDIRSFTKNLQQNKQIYNRIKKFQENKQIYNRINKFTTEYKFISVTLVSEDNQLIKNAN